MNKMKVTIINQVAEGHDHSREYETLKSMTLIGLPDGKMTEIIRVRWYMGRSAGACHLYCSVWIDTKDVTTSGSSNQYTGQNNRFGELHIKAIRRSFYDALKSAGVELTGFNTEDWKNDNLSEAIKVIGKSLGYNNTHLVQ